MWSHNAQKRPKPIWSLCFFSFPLRLLRAKLNIKTASNQQTKLWANAPILPAQNKNFLFISFATHARVCYNKSVKKSLHKGSEMNLKNKSNFVSKFLVSSAFALVAFFAFVLAFVLPKTSASSTTASASTDGAYGEIRITNSDGSILVVAGNGCSGNRFIAGSEVSIYVVVEDGTRTPSGATSPVPSTFVGDVSNQNWNYMLSSIIINGVETEPNARIAPLSFNSNSQPQGSNASGGYQVFKNCDVYNLTAKQDGQTETRYLVHTTTVSSSLNIRASFSYVQKTNVKVHFNSKKRDSLSFVHYATNGESLSDILSGARLANNAKVLFSSEQVAFFGWYDLSDETTPVLLTDESALSANAEATDAQTTKNYGALLFATATLSLSSTTSAQQNGAVGGTATISSSNYVFGRANTTTKYFLSTASGQSQDFEDFVLSAPNGTFVSLSASPAQGFQFVGWFKNGELFSTTLQTNVSFSTLASGDKLEARFAQTINLSAVVTTNGLSSTEGGSAFFTSSVFAHGTTQTLSAYANNNFLFAGFFVNGTRLTSQNAADLLGSSVGFEISNELSYSNSCSATFTQTKNAIVEARFVSSKTLTISTNKVSDVFNFEFFDSSLFGDTIRIFVNGAEVSASFQNKKFVLALPQDASVVLEISTSGKMFNFNNLSSANGGVLLVGNSAYAPDSATHSHSFEMNQNKDLVVSFNPYFVRSEVQILNASLWVSVFPVYNSANELVGVSGIYFDIVPAVGNIFQSATIVSGDKSAPIDKTSVHITSENLSALGSKLGTNLSMVDVLKIVLSETSDGATYTTAQTDDANLNTLVASSSATGHVEVNLKTAHSVSVLATSPEFGAFSSAVATIWQNGNQIATNLSSPVLVEGGSSISILAAYSVVADGKTYVFSHYELDGTLLAGIGIASDANVSAQASANGFVVVFDANRSASVVAVYREVVEVSVSSTTNDQKDSTPKIQLSGGISGATAMGSTITILSTDRTNFSHFVVSVWNDLNSNSQKDAGEVSTSVYTTSSINLTVQAGLSVEAVHKTKVNTNPTSVLSNTSNVLYGTLTHTSSGFFLTFDSNAGSVSSSATTLVHGQKLSVSATCKTSHVFVGWFKISTSSELTYQNLEFVTSSEVLSVSVSANTKLVALFAQAKSLSVQSNIAGATPTLTDIQTGTTHTNQVFGYAGQQFVFETAEANFLGWYNVTNGQFTLLSESQAFTYTLLGDTNIVAQYGNLSFSATTHTNKQISTAGGSVSVSFADGRGEFSGAQISTRFAYSQTRPITLSAIANAGYKFVGWFTSSNFDGNELVSTSSTISIPASSNVSVFAHFVKTLAFELNVVGTTNTAGAIGGVPTSLVFGDQITLQAYNLSGYAFKSFEVYQNGSLVAQSATSTVSFVAEGDIEVVATYQKTVQLAVSSTLSSAQIVAKQNGNQVLSLPEIFAGNTTIEVSFDANVAKFMHFVVNGVETSGTVSAGVASIEINITSNTQVVAIFQNLTTLVSETETLGGTNGGSVSLTQNGSAFVGPTASVGTTYTATAVAESGFRFVGFKVSGTFVPSVALSSSEITFRLTTATKVTAVFAKEITLSVSVLGNGSVLADGQKLNFQNGSATFVATYGQIVNFVFVAESGSSVSSVSAPDATVLTSSSAQIAATQNSTVAVEFASSVFVQMGSNANSNPQVSHAVSGTESVVQGPAIFVATGAQVSLHAPLFADNKVFVGFFANGERVGASYAHNAQSNLVSATTALNQNSTIEARYEAKTTLFVSAQNNTSPLSSLISVSIENNVAPWLLSSATTASNRIEIAVPSTMLISVEVLDTTNFSGWYFVANQSDISSTYNFNLLSSSASVSLFATKLNEVTQNPYLMCAFGGSQTNNIPAPAFGLVQTNGGTAEMNGQTLTATPNSGNKFVAFEVQIGLSNSSLWLRVSAQNSVTILRDDSLGIVTITDSNSNVVYNGYAIGVRAVFAPATNSDFVSGLQNFNNNSSNSVVFVGTIPSFTNPAYAPEHIHKTGTKVSLSVVSKTANSVTMPSLAQIRTVFGSQAEVSQNTITFYLENIVSLANYQTALEALGFASTTLVNVQTTSSQNVQTQVSANGASAVSQQVALGSSVTLSVPQIQTEEQMHFFPMVDAGSRLVFVGWFSGQTLLASNPTATITVSAPLVAEARFAIYHLVTTKASASNITNTYVLHGADHVVSASADASHEFLGFEISNNSSPALFLPSTDAQIASSGSNFAYAFSVLQPTTIQLHYADKKVVSLEAQSFDNSGAQTQTAGGVVFANGQNASTITAGNAPIILSASATEGSVFAGFYERLSDGTMRLLSASATLAVSAQTLSSSAESVVAVFRTKVSEFVITSNVSGAIAQISGALGVGQTTTLSAPSLSGYNFVGWFDASGNVVASTSSLVYTLTSNTILEMRYAKMHSFSVSTVGNGTVSGSTPTSVQNGQTVQLSASTNSSNVFVGWKVNGVFVSQNPTLSVLVLSQTSVEAVFETAKEVSINPVQTSNWFVVVSSGVVQLGSNKVDVLQFATPTTFVVSQNAVLQILARTTIPQKQISTSSIDGTLQTINSRCVQITVSGTTIAKNPSVAVQTKNTVLVSATPVGANDITISGTGEHALKSQASLSFVAPANTQIVTDVSQIEYSTSRALVFVGWFQNGTLLSTAQTLTFSATESTNIEARFVEFFRVFVGNQHAGTVLSDSVSLVSPSGEALGADVCVQVSQNYYFVKSGTTIKVVASSQDAFALGVIANSKLISSNQVLGQGAEATLSVGSALEIYGSFAQKVTLKFEQNSNTSGIGGTFGLVSYVVPFTKTTYQLSADRTSFEIEVPYSSIISVSAVPCVGCTFVSWEGTPNTVSETNADISFRVTETANIVATFNRTFVLNVQTIQTNGTVVSDVANVSQTQNTATLIIPTTLNGQTFSHFVYQNSLGLQLLLGNTQDSIRQVFEGCVLSQTQSSITLSNIILSQDTTIICVYNSAASDLFTCLSDQGESVGATISLATPDSAIAHALVLGETYVATAPQTVDKNGTTYRFVRFIKNGQEFSSSNEIWFVAGSNNYVAQYSPVYEVSVQVSNATFGAQNNAGSVFGNGKYLYSQTSKLSAVANDGFMFVGWYDQNKQLLSENSVYDATSSVSPAYAVFVPAFNLSLQTSVGGSVVGSFENTFGATSTILSSGNVAVCMIKTGATVVLTITCKNGYKFTGLVDQNGNAIATTQVSTSEFTATVEVTTNLALSATFEKQVTVSASVQTNYKTTPTTQGSFTINGQGVSQVTVAAGTQIQIDVTLPTSATATYTLLGVYVGGKRISGTGNVFTFAATQNLQVKIVFAEIVDVQVSASDTINQVTYTQNGVELTPNSSDKLSLPLGSIVSVNAQASKGYQFVHHITNGSENHTQNPFQVVVDQNLSSVETVFEQSTRELSIYFPASVRNFQGKITGVPVLSMYLFKNGTLVATISGDNIVSAESIEISGDYVVWTMPQGASDTITVQFGGSISSDNTTAVPTLRTDVYAPNGTLISSAHIGTPNTVASFTLIDSTNALSFSRVEEFDYNQRVKIEATHNSQLSSDDKPLEYALNVLSPVSNNTTQVSKDAAMQIIETWVPVGSEVSVTAKIDSRSGSSIIPEIAFLNAGMISELDFIQTWKDKDKGGTYPSYASWEGVSASSTGANTHIFRASGDTSIIADYLDIWKVSEKVVQTVATNSIAGGILSGDSSSVSHGSQTFAYNISVSETDQNTSFAQNATVHNGLLVYVSAGMLVNGVHVLSVSENSFTYFNGTEYVTAGIHHSISNGNVKFTVSEIIKPENDDKFYLVGRSTTTEGKLTHTNVQMIGSLSANAPASQLTTNTNLANITASTMDKKQGSASEAKPSSLDFTPNGAYDTFGSTAPTSMQSIKFTASSTLEGAVFKGFIVVHNPNVNVKTSNILIKPTGADIYQSGGLNDRFTFLSHAFIPASECTQVGSIHFVILPFAGRTEVIALYEKDIFTITPQKHAMFKSDANGVVTIDGTQVQITSEDKHQIADETVRNSVVAIQKVGEFYYVFTSLEANNGTIKGSLVFEHGDTARIDATVFHYGELAGYTLTPKTNDVTYWLTSSESVAQSSTANANTATLISVNRDASNANIAYNKQTLSFVVTQNFDLVAYFSSMHYEVTIEFAELVNKAGFNSDAEILFNDYNIATKQGQGAVREEWKTLSSFTHYLSNTDETNVSLIQNLLTITNDVGEPIPYKIVYGGTNDNGSVKGLAIKFNINAKAGAGFDGFVVNFNRKNFGASGTTSIFAQKDDSTTKTSAEFSPVFQNRGSTNSAVSFSYNNNIGATNDIAAADYTSYVKNPTIVIATNKNTTRVSVEKNKNVVVQGKSEEESSKDARQIIVVKGGNTYYEQIKNNRWMEDVNTYFNNAAQLDELNNPNKDNIETAFNSIKDNQGLIDALSSYIKALSLPISTATGSGDTAKTYFDILPTLFEENGVVDGISRTLKVRLENGRYLTLDGTTLVGHTIDEGAYSSFEIDWASGTVQLNPSFGATSITLPLIVEVTVSGYTMEMYSCNYEDATTIQIDQNDLCIDRDKITSDQTLETHVVQKDDLLDSNGRIQGKYWYHWQTVSADRAYDYFAQQTLSFSAKQNDTYLSTYLTTTGSSSVRRNADSIARWSVWDIYYNNNIDDFISMSKQEDMQFNSTPKYNGTNQFSYGGSGRFHAYLYAFFAADKSTCDASQNTTITIQKEKNDEEASRVKLDNYDLQHKTREETWQIILSFLSYAGQLYAYNQMAPTLSMLAIFDDDDDDRYAQMLQATFPREGYLTREDFSNLSSNTKKAYALSLQTKLAVAKIL